MKVKKIEYFIIEGIVYSINTLENNDVKIINEGNNKTYSVYKNNPKLIV